MTKQKTPTSIHPGQWEVIDGMARPKNPKGDEPYVRDCICSDCIQDNERDEEEWKEFDQFATQNTYPAPGLKDAIYEAEQLQVVTEEVVNGEWREVLVPHYIVLEPNIHVRLAITATPTEVKEPKETASDLKGKEIKKSILEHTTTKFKNGNMVKSVNHNQHEIIHQIITLHTGPIELDPTYSKGNFYKKYGLDEPLEKFDLYPQTDDCLQGNANDLPHFDDTISCIMFDPPFIVGHTRDKPSGIIGERFHGFRYIADLWEWYDECIIEFHRILEKKGWLIFKCQDTVSSGKQYLSHVHIINEAEKAGFYTKDLFILTANNRIIGHNHANQKHARKFHSYFIVFQKK